MRRRGPALLLVLGALALGACDHSRGSDTAPAADVGSISLELTAGGGFRFSEVSYDISGNGFHRAATVSVVNSTVISTIVGGIPFGTGYHVTLAAQDVLHQLTACQGTATFDVQGTATVPVPVHMTCHEVAGTPPPPPPPPSVPVPRPAIAALGGILLALGAKRAGRGRTG